MSIHSTFEGAGFTADALNIAQDNGISLRIGTCFSEYADIVSMGRPHQPVGRPFDFRHNDFDPTNGFWIVGRNEKGELVHSQALRLVNLEGKPLSSYLSDRFVDFPPPGIDLDYKKSRYNPGPSARRISGTVGYHGDFWLSSDYRGTGMCNILARFALASGLLRWSPDYVIGFMINPIALKGLAEREGYMHSEPGALFWHLANSDKVIETFMVWMAREDINHLQTIPLQGFVRQPAPSIGIAAE